jgi:hypothetical protein
MTGESVDDDGCRIFIDREGKMIRVMCCDYGFRAGAGRLYQDNYGEVPQNVFRMVREGRSVVCCVCFLVFARP